MIILFDDLLPSFSQLNNSAFVESLVLRGKKLNFEVSRINDNRMVQGQDYTVDESSLPSLTPIIFCKWPKMYVVWRYFDGRWHLYELPVLAAFPSFIYKHHTSFSELALRFYLFGSNKVKCDENGHLESAFQIGAKQ